MLFHEIIQLRSLGITAYFFDIQSFIFTGSLALNAIYLKGAIMKDIDYNTL